MQSLRSLLAAVALIALSTGSSISAGTPVKVNKPFTGGALTIMGDFSGQRVTIYSDDALIYSAKIVTNASTGVAGSLTFALKEKKILFRAEVASLRTKKSFVFDQNKGRFVYLGLDKKKLSWSQMKSPLLLD
jgi:hypothetical protein